MNVHELKSPGLSVRGPKAESGQRSIFGAPGRIVMSRWLALTLVAIGIMMAHALPAQAQEPAWIPCPPQQPLLRVPELVSKDGKLRGTILLISEEERMTFRQPPQSKPGDPGTIIKCQKQFVRAFRGLNAVPAPTASKDSYLDPMPGPTLRARVGDIVELTFINQINTLHFPNSDRGDTGVGGGCDESSVGYPGDPKKGGDTFPDCFHGSSTANIHFHGTHTNPNSTGDNVFIEVRPSVRESGKPIVTPESVKKPFDEFFGRCEAQLNLSVLNQWPKTWNDLPKSWTDEQEFLLKLSDSQLQRDYGNTAKRLWPVVANQLKQLAWPQYYVGAYPYCFRLPAYTPPPPSTGAMASMPMMGMHAQPSNGGAGTAEQGKLDMNAMDQGNDLGPIRMGQAPGTHWYHAHKHGSTTIDVSNGMTGAFIIEGQYDDDLNSAYGTGWTRTQPVMVINQLGSSPNLLKSNPGQTDKGPNFSINGQMNPLVQMYPGEVQMWRIVNTSSRAGAFFMGPPDGFEWRQLAQDGVQFVEANYQSHHNNSFLLAAGNRADLLVKAPTKTGKYSVQVKNEVDPGDLPGMNPAALFSVNVSGSGPAMSLLEHAPSFPSFLSDIKASEVKGTKEITFTSGSPGGLPTPAQHKIDGKKFDGEVGAVVLLNTVEEWKIVNKTIGISHPFHIHINPFQIVEVFDPNEKLNITDSSGPTVSTLSAPKYVFDPSLLKYASQGQCYLNPNDPSTWKPCPPPVPCPPCPTPQTGPPPPPPGNLVWWDVFPIPSGVKVTDASGKPVIDPNDPSGKQLIVPGYFKMRSRFVDYSGYYVIHCHILAHEDRGMMTIVEVAPARTPYSHH